MIFAGILNIAIPLVILVQVVVSLLLVLVVLMQRPKQEGLGATFGAGMTDQMFGAQTTSVLQKATVWFGIVFFAATLLLTILVNQKNSTKQISVDPTTETVADSLDKVEEETTEVSLAEQLEKAETSPEAVKTEVIEIKEPVEAAKTEVVEEVKVVTEPVKETVQAAIDKVESKASEAIGVDNQEEFQKLKEEKTSE